MKNHNESGLTLVEVLAVTIVTSLILLAIYSIIIQSTNTYKSQTSTNKELNDAAYALKVMTKELRKNPNAITVYSMTELIINKDDANKEIRFVFDEEQKAIIKNDVIFSRDIKEFKSRQDGRVITIKITSLNNKTFSTEIYLREGDIR